MRPGKHVAVSPDLQELADLQVEAMQIGYDNAVDETVRGKIVIGEEASCA